MDAKVHSHITEKALEWQSADSKKFWADTKETLLESSVYPDVFSSPGFVRKLDEEREPEWREYMFIQRRGKTEFMTNLYKTEMPEDIRKTLPHVLKYYISKCLKNIKNGNRKKAAKFAGCISHIIGDTGQPAHVASDELMSLLAPYPEGKSIIYHFAVESVLGKASGTYSPRLLGATIDEVIWRITEEFEILRKKALAEEIKILKALYSDNISEAEKSADIAVQACAELFADILLTVYSLADTDKAANAFALPEFLTLAAFVPLNKSCDMIFHYAPMIDRHVICVNKRFVPMVDFDLGTGEKVKGLALLANMAPSYEACRDTFVEYTIPKGVYKYFESTVGLNHLCENGTGAVFEVWLDGKKAYESKVVKNKDRGIEIKIELGNSHRIKLRARDERPAPCPTAFFYPIWASPRLTERI